MGHGGNPITELAQWHQEDTKPTESSGKLYQQTDQHIPVLVFDKKTSYQIGLMLSESAALTVGIG